MKIFVPSFNRPETNLTGNLLDAAGLDYQYVLHSEEQKDLYVAAGSSSSNITVSGVPYLQGLGGQRAFIHDNLVEEGEWYIQMDDNVERFTRLADPFYEIDHLYANEGETWFSAFEDRMIQDICFNEEVPADEIMPLMDSMIAECESRGAHLCGFASTKNTFFRGKKWTEIGFVVGKVMVIHKSGKPRFNPDYFTSDDYQISAEHLKFHGRILRNNYIYPDFPRYMVGGLGKLQERFEPYATAAKQLMEDYPSMFNFSIRADMPYGSSVRMRFTDRSEKSLNKWREENGGLELAGTIAEGDGS